MDALMTVLGLTHKNTFLSVMNWSNARNFPRYCLTVIVPKDALCYNYKCCRKAAGEFVTILTLNKTKE